MTYCSDKNSHLQGNYFIACYMTDKHPCEQIVIWQVNCGKYKLVHKGVFDNSLIKSIKDNKINRLSEGNLEILLKSEIGNELPEGITKLEDKHVKINYSLLENRGVSISYSQAP